MKVTVNKKEMWKSFKSCLKWAFLALLLSFLLLLLKDLYDTNNALIRLNTQQSSSIDTLQSQLSEVTQANAHLVDQLQVEQAKVEQLQVKINGQPIVMTQEDIQEEVEPQLSSPSLVPLTIIGTLTIMKELIFRVPALF